MDSFWLHLKSVHITTPMEDDGQIEVKVDRTIHRKFIGSYEVTIRRVNGVNQEPICKGTPLTPFPYDPSRDLPEPLSLTWWLGGKANMNICRENGFQAGHQFQIRTCHTVRVTVWELPFARRCVLSNVFSLV